MSEFLNNFTEEVKNNTSGFIAVAVTEIKTGVSYASVSVDPNFDVELAAAYNLEVVRAKLTAIKVLGLTQDIEDIIITLTSHIHIIAISPNKEYFIYLAVDSTKANLGMTRAMVRKYGKELEGNI